MKIRLAIFCVAIALVLPTAHVAEPSTIESKFHAPQTEAEKVLDTIFDLEDKDSNMLFFALGTPFYDPAKDTGYAQLFTRALLKAWRTKEADRVRDSCDGKYREGEICGFDYDVIICAQDRPKKFVFRTIKSGQESTTIVAAWPQFVKYEDSFIVYRMVKESGVWKLDGVDCRKGDLFNMPSPW